MKSIIRQFPVKVYNTLSKEKEIFNPIHEGRIGMYVCGPTVYGEPHLGHARSAVSFDIIRRYFKWLGYQVRYVRNITDVGHLENEVLEEGEDKISKKAKAEQLEPMEIAYFYTQKYHEAMDKMGVERPSIEPLASGHIIEQIEIISKIIDNGLAYVVNGSVYFDLKKYSDTHTYGELSGKIIEDLRVATRNTEGQGEKRNPLDFALWKKASETHIMKWNSPWSLGFPGWHIECTAMSTKYLGIPFDIHGGGLDLQFPHHEAELAQCKGAFNEKVANYWLHNNLLTIDGQKMSKSLGNFINLEQMFSGKHPLLDQAYHPMVIRFFMLQAHYGSPIDFSNRALKAAEKGYARLQKAWEQLNELLPSEEAVEETLDRQIEGLCDRCYENMSDDFNTPKTIAVLFDLASKIQAFKNGQLKVSSLSENTFYRMKETFSAFYVEVLGFHAEGVEDHHEEMDHWKESFLKMLIEIRSGARKNNDYALADKIRDDLAQMGYEIKDGKSGTQITEKK